MKPSFNQFNRTVCDCYEILIKIFSVEVFHFLLLSSNF